jgi:Ca2+-binding EF-hand superfamily protein
MEDFLMGSRLPLAFLLLAFSSPLAVDAYAGQTQQARMRFEVMDRNRDGVIQREEWSGSARSFQVHDWNGDGRLAGNEVRIGAQRNNDQEVADHVPGRAERYLNWTAAGFTSLDHNRDTRITANEWHFDLESFRRADRNRDDVLTRPEFLGGDGEDDDREDSFDDLDMNNNGLVERAEWHASGTMFSLLDRNKDGVLSRFEVVGSTPSRDTYDEFAIIDSNRNSTIERGEWQWSTASFNQRDANRDGRISRAELDAAGAPGTATTATVPSAAGSQTVRINAQQRWTDSGLMVRAGDTITFDASGSIVMSADNNDTASPAGSTRGRTAPDAPVLNQLAGGLIMRIDGYGPTFIGARRTITAPVSGRVFLGVNDDHLPDNRGEFVVNVGVRGRTSR